MVICICGKSGSGKSTLAESLLNCYENSIHVDIDKIGHKILNFDEVKKDLRSSFGNVIFKDGFIDRKLLSKIVFKSEENMNILTQITWKYMEREIDDIISKNKNGIVILDWLLLPKTKYFKSSSLKILLDIPEELRCERVLLRDGISRYDFLLRDSASIDYNKEDFDYVFDEVNIEKMKVLVNLK